MVRTTRAALPILLAVALAGCSSTAPEIPITFTSSGLPGGKIQGVQSTTEGGATFAASGDNLTCSGSYYGLDRATTVTTTLLCSDSRKGSVTMTGTGGRATSGTFKLDDGTQGQVTVGG